MYSTVCAKVPPIVAGLFVCHGPTVATGLHEYDKVSREHADDADHPRYPHRLIELELIDRERRVRATDHGPGIRTSSRSKNSTELSRLKRHAYCG